MNDPGLRIHALAVELGRSADGLLKRRYGVSYPRARLLRALRGDGAATQHELAQRLGIEDAAVSRMLPGLVARGWCEVSADPRHGRRRRVRLTDTGAEMERECSDFLASAFRGAAEDAGVDVARFLTDVDALVEWLRRPSPSHVPPADAPPSPACSATGAAPGPGSHTPRPRRPSARSPRPSRRTDR